MFLFLVLALTIVDIFTNGNKNNVSIWHKNNNCSLSVKIILFEVGHVLVNEVTCLLNGVNRLEIQQFWFAKS